MSGTTGRFSKSQHTHTHTQASSSSSSSSFLFFSFSLLLLSLSHTVFPLPRLPSAKNVVVAKRRRHNCPSPPHLLPLARTGVRYIEPWLDTWTPGVTRHLDTIDTIDTTVKSIDTLRHHSDNSTPLRHAQDEFRHGRRACWLLCQPVRKRVNVRLVCTSDTSDMSDTSTHGISKGAGRRRWRWHSMLTAAIHTMALPTVGMYLTYNDCTAYWLWGEEVALLQ